jgi:hypothetical protein
MLENSGWVGLLGLKPGLEKISNQLENVPRPGRRRLVVGPLALYRPEILTDLAVDFSNWLENAGQLGHLGLQPGLERISNQLENVPRPDRRSLVVGPQALYRPEILTDLAVDFSNWLENAGRVGRFAPNPGLPGDSTTQKTRTPAIIQPRSLYSVSLKPLPPD